VGELLWRVIVVVGAAAVGLLASCLLSVTLRWLARRSRHQLFLTRLHSFCHLPATALLLVAVPGAAMVGLTPAVQTPIRHGLLLALIAATAWLVIKVLFVVEDAAFRWLRVDVVGNRRVRRVRTQIASCAG
jgi:hypothetical protein